MQRNIIAEIYVNFSMNYAETFTIEDSFPNLTHVSTMKGSTFYMKQNHEWMLLGYSKEDLCKAKLF
jgi:hypothetical protein